MAAKIYIVEARNEAGELDTSPERQPPLATMASARQLQEYHDEITGNYMATFAEVVEWFRRQGWYVRERGW